MIYIFVATKTEAQPFVEYFGLKKQKFPPYTLYCNNCMKVIVTHIGIHNATKAAKFFQPYINPKDKIYNIGIAAAPKELYKIGECVLIAKVQFKNKTITLNNAKTILESVLTPQEEKKAIIVDMEGFALANIFPNITIYKVISDHFEPKKINKDEVKKMIAKKIECFKLE